MRNCYDRGGYTGAEPPPRESEDSESDEEEGTEGDDDGHVSVDENDSASWRDTD